MVRNTAFSATTTGLSSGARVATLSVDASLVDGAVRVCLATGSASSATAHLSSGTLSVVGALHTASALFARFATAAIAITSARLRAEAREALGAGRRAFGIG